MPTAVFFLAGNGQTDAESNKIALLGYTHAVKIVPRSMLSIEGYLTGAEFVAAMERKHIRVEARDFLCRLFDNVGA